VLSEACLPVVDAAGAVVGLLGARSPSRSRVCPAACSSQRADAEAHREGFFGPRAVRALALTCALLGGKL
jgi:hypothetical protein